MRALSQVTDAVRGVTSAVHAVAASGFSAESAATYDAGRPDWQLSHARAALALAGVSRSSRASADGRLFPARPILELGAGTGKFTAALVASVAEIAPAGAVPHIVCAEPSEGFSAAWRARVRALGAAGSGLTLLNAPASALSGVADGSCAAAFAAQALHWFADDSAGLELARVLGSGRTLVALWNCRDAGDSAWVRAYEAAIHDAYEPGTPSWLARRWETWARSSPHFVQPPAVMRWTRDGGGHFGNAETMLAAAMSISEIARKAPAERAIFQERLRAAIALAPPAPTATAANAAVAARQILMPMFTEVLVMRVAGDPSPLA